MSPSEAGKALNDRQALSRSQSWTQDPEGVRRAILLAAREEFAEKGLSGTRVDDIAARIATAKRMIFYYFGSKQGLYIAVLEQAYADIRAIERGLDMSGLPPREALAELVGFTFDYHVDNPAFVRLVMVENIHHGQHLRMSERIGRLNSSAIEVIRDICQRGMEAGVFRAGVSPVELHLSISALCFYNVANRATVQLGFGIDMVDPEFRGRRRQCVIDMILRSVRA
ncbi:MAG: TetR/AcrR family transcriptional regulator [Beijerinckiaceae bacterium]